MTHYLHAWYADQSARGGWTSYSPETLRADVLPFYETHRRDNAPLTLTRLGRDAMTCDFIVRRRTNKGNLYDIRWRV